jgi:CheY-like chemotaxis protein
LQGLRVLVVEDDADAQRVLNGLLRERDADVTVATSAAEGFEQFVRLRPDVLISDIAMPQEDGYSLLRRVRAFEREHAMASATPAIAITAYARADDRGRAMEAGFNCHIAKPVHADELIGTVAELAGRSSANA